MMARMNKLVGLWTAEFGSTLGISGSGVVVFRETELMGGDNGFYYRGTYSVEGSAVEAILQAIPFDLTHPSIFATLGKEVELKLSGQISDTTILAHGFLVQDPSKQLGVKLTRRF